MAPKYQHIRFFSLDEYGINNRLYPSRLAYSEKSNDLFLAYSWDKIPNFLFSFSLNENDTPAAQHIKVPDPIYGITVGQNDEIFLNSGGNIMTASTDLGNIISKQLISNESGDIPWTWFMQSHPDGWVGGISTETFFWFHESDNRLKKVDLADVLPGVKDIRFEGFRFGDDNKAIFWSTSRIHEADLTSGKFYNFQNVPQLDDMLNYITCTEWDENGNIWISTNSYLIKTQLEGKRLSVDEVFSTNDGIISPTIAEFQFDNSGRIWLFSNSGMDALDPATREVRHFGIKEGLPMLYVDPVEVLELSDGSLATVSNNGPIVFHPDSLWHAFDPENVPVVIQDLRVNGKTFTQEVLPNFTEEVHLPLSASMVDLSFNALTFPKNNKIDYSYRLNEESGDWIYIGSNNFLTLPDLPFGKTTLEIKAGPPDNDVSGKKIYFIKPVPVYAQKWLLQFIIVTIIATVLGIAFFRIRQIEAAVRKEMEINRQLAETELKALRSQMNPHFMFNSLNSIKSYVLQAKPDIAADYLAQFAHLIRKILQNSG